MDRFDWVEVEPPADRRPKPVSDTPSAYELGKQKRASGDFAGAAEDFQRAVGADDHNYAAWVLRVDSLVRAGHLVEADTVSADALQNYGQVRPFYAARALVLAHQNRIDAAYRNSDISLDDGKRYWYARCVRGEVLLKDGVENRFEALRHFEESIGFAQAPWHPCFLAGWSLLQAGLSTLAAPHFADAAHHNPLAAAPWLFLGDCFHELRLYDQAMFYYRRVVELEPKHPLVLDRQRACSPKTFGLMDLFQKDLLHDRWREAMLRALDRPNPDDL